MTIARINQLVCVAWLVTAASASAQLPTVSPELLLRITTNTPLDLKITNLDGVDVDLANMRGKVVLLDFWATWCGPCLKELPSVLAAYKKFHDRGFEIIGISLDENKATLVSFVKARGMNWPVYFDEKKQLSQRFGIEGIPTMWLIDKQGLLVNLNARKDLQGSVEKLLAQ